MPGREQIDGAMAQRLFDELGDWHDVAQVMVRETGQPFQTDSICTAARRHRKAMEKNAELAREGFHDATSPV